ncbi:hypothetical protein B0H13DRAFT_1897967 [Mycena leptocephala]|nr:hypothetical protein B0H13DRAFT_1897967 [Mycena leptocephala]
MTILLTGGTGRSATPLAQRLQEAGVPVILANRSGKVPAPFRGVRFDWADETTYCIPFEAASDIDKIYLVAPQTLDVFPPMKMFIDLAVEKGVGRFVLMSAAAFDVGGPIVGKVHEYLHSLHVEYCALRPTWFFDNLLLDYSDHIREHDRIVNAAGNGLIGWISTEDIADIAYRALTDPIIEHTNPIMVGPELLSYSQIAQTMTEVLGRKITHKNVSEEENTRVMLARGMPADYAALMSVADVGISQGGHERLYEKADFIGKRTLREFVEEHRDAEEWRHA